MGLDIHWVLLDRPATPEEAETDEDCTIWHVGVYNPEWQDRLGYVPTGHYYTTESGDGPHWSYSGYNEFRRQLCQSVLNVDPRVVWENEEAFAPLPLVKLIAFSDCEGAIAGTMVDKIASELRMCRGRMSFDNDWYLERYDQLLKCFEEASAAQKRTGKAAAVIWA